MTKATKSTVHPLKTWIAWAFPQPDQSLLCPHEESLDPYLPSEHTAKTLIRLDGCPSDLSLCWVHMSFCWFCHAAAQIKDSYELPIKVSFSHLLSSKLIHVMRKPVFRGVTYRF